MSSGLAPAAPAVEAVQAAQPGEEKPRCDILLFVATTSEIEAVEEAAKALNLKFQKRKGWASKYFDLGLVGDSRVMVLKTKMGPFSFGGSASKAIHAKIETGATALISVGMAFGVDRETQPIGTLLVSKILLPYDNREVITVEDKTVVDYSDVTPHNAKAALTQMLEREAERAEWPVKFHLAQS